MMAEDPPEGCFWLTTGRPINPELLASIRALGRVALCRFFLDQSLNEQSRYKLLRGFYPMSFREFKLLEQQEGGRDQVVE